MTPVDDVRARLERMVALAEAIPHHETWTPLWHAYNRATYVPDYAFIADASPDLLLRVAREALGVLNRHFPVDAYPDACNWCEYSQPVRWPCAEARSILRAWQP